MKKIFLALAALAAMTAVSCVKDEQNPDALVPEEKPVKYTDLILNEINGTGEDSEKYVEIYNKGTEAISLLDVTLEYNGDVTWSGAATDVIQPSGYFVVLGTKKADNAGSMMSKGLSAGKYITVGLYDPKGTELDLFQRGDGSGDSVADGEIEGMDYSRMPNATGGWYYTDAAGTRGADNGTSTDGLTALGNEPEVPAGALVLNEINGTGEDADKYIELYNGTDAEISLAGYTMTYNDELTWTAENSDVIAAGGYLVLKGTKKTGDMQKGLSAGKNIKVVLLDADEREVDVFQRGAGDGSEVAGDETSGVAYCRLPNGFGDWYMTTEEGSEGEDNGSDATGFEKVK